MAIPFNLPSDEQTENNYRNMDDLLLQLYQVLRQILLHREPPVDFSQRNNNRSTSTPTATPRHVEPSVVAASAEAAPTPTELLPRLPLPDIVQSSTPTPRRPTRRRPTTTTTTTTSMPPQPPPRRARRRRVKEDEKVAATVTVSYDDDVQWMEPCYRQEVYRKVEVRDNWAQVGEDLRKIADEFHQSTATLQDEPDLSTTAATASNHKGISLLSLLLPVPFNGSLWMAMFFLLGWNVLQRAR